MKQREKKNKQGDSDDYKSRGRTALLSHRPYSMVSIFFQTLFRKRMGERYFNFDTFLGGIFMLSLLNMLTFGSFGGYDLLDWHPDKTWVLTPFDSVIGGYTLISFWHFIEMSSLRRKGQSVHSYFMGYSRFIPIGIIFLKVLNYIISFPFRLFKVKSFQFNIGVGFYSAYYFFEPLVAILLGLLATIIFDSPFMLLAGLIGGVKLLWENIKRIRGSYLWEMEREDARIVSDELRKVLDLREMKQQRYEKKKQEDQFPLVSQKSSSASVSKTPIDSPSVEDILKKVNNNTNE